MSFARVSYEKFGSQKAPSAKRCIKTAWRLHQVAPSPSQKAPSAKRCIKTGVCWLLATALRTCQKAPSAKRCIKTA